MDSTNFADNSFEDQLSIGFERYIAAIKSDAEASAHAAILDALRGGWDISVVPHGYLRMLETSRHPSPYTFLLRQFPSSDLEVFDQIFLRKFYLPFVQHIKQFSHPLKINLVIDAGANIGLSAIFFAHMFQHSTVCAIEPQLANFNLLRHNTSLNARERIQTIHGALWSDEGYLHVISGFRDGREWAYQTKKEEEMEDGERVKCYTLQQLLQSALASHIIDVLKLDVEGAEFPILSDPATMELIRSQVRFICLEIHDECGDADLLIAKLRTHFNLYHSEELIYGRNGSLV